MLSINIPASEGYDEYNNKFYYQPDVTLVMEHSLFSISKWESETERPFLNQDSFTHDDLILYYKCMTVNDVDDSAYDRLTYDMGAQINKYMGRKMTATWFYDSDKPRFNQPNRDIITSEIIYYWMFALGIPMECDKWHINKLLTMIRVCEEKQNPKKMSRMDIFAQQRELNAMRKAQLGTRG